MPRTPLFVALCVLAVTVASGCEQRSVSTLAGPTPVQNSTTAAPAPSFLGNWSSVTLVPTGKLTPSSAPAAFDPSTCRSFQWNITTQTASAVSGAFSVVCQDGMALSGMGSGAITSPTTITLTFNGAGSLPAGQCNFSITSNGTLEGKDTLRLPYNGTSCLGSFSGTAVLRRNDLYPEPTQDPTPEPAQEPMPTVGPVVDPMPTDGPAGDALDLHNVTVVMGANLTNWAVTSTMTRAYYHSGWEQLCTEHTKAGLWPKLPWFGDVNVPVEGNQWMFAFIGGRWYGAAGEWLRPGQVCKNVAGHIGEGAFYGTIMEAWTPQPGELVGIAVSTPARAGQWGTAERSNVVLIRW